MRVKKTKKKREERACQACVRVSQGQTPPFIQGSAFLVSVFEDGDDDDDARRPLLGSWDGFD